MKGGSPTSVIWPLAFPVLEEWFEMPVAELHCLGDEDALIASFKAISLMWALTISGTCLLVRIKN